MSQRVKVGVLAGLLAILAYTFSHFWLSGDTGPANAPQSVGASTREAAGTNDVPVSVPDLRLQAERLRSASSSETITVERNIFEYGRVRVPQPGVAVRRPTPQPQIQTPPTPPPPPPAPLRFYGFAESQQGGSRRVFLTDGDEIYVAGEGDVVAKRYRVARIGANNLELEDIVGGHRWVLWLEMPQ